MEIISSLATWLANNIFGVPTFLLMLIVLAGHLLQKSPVEKIISGTIKAGVGFLVINAGSSVISGSLTSFTNVWSEVFGLHSTSYADKENFTSDFGSTVALIMLFGFLINVLLARFTKFKYIYLTGHMMWWVSLIFTGVIVNAFPDISKPLLICILSPIMGLYWTFQPALTQKYVRLVTGGNDVALGHTAGVGAWLAGLCGNLFAKNKKDTESINFPKSLSFLRDNNVITGLVMIVFFIIGSAIVMIKNTESGAEIMAASGTQSFMIYGIVQSLTFVAGIAVVLTGVKMFVGEMVPAFRGISSKMVPNAVPALDCPILFTYAPNATVIGFFGAFLGAIIWMAILGVSAEYVFVPSMIVLFFHGATAGILGNSTGGIKGAFLGGIIIGTIVAIGQWACITFFIDGTIPATAAWAGDTDQFVIAPVISMIGKLLSGIF
ncbi:MAG: PTS ascorbate transporter subunit IIC [Anaerocolumna sp.]